MVKAVKRRSVSSVSVRSDGSLEKTKSSPVVGAHGARDGRAVERAEGAAGAEGILSLPTDRTLTELTERRFAAFNIKK